MKIVPGTLALLILCGISAGCSHQISGGPESGVDMKRYRTYYIATDEPGDATKAIEADLRARGLSVSAGPASTVPPAADCKVLVKDKWMWDITMYLLEVKLEMVDGRTGAMLASGRCYRTSVVRKPADVMVKEITDRIFGTTAEKTAAAAVVAPEGARAAAK